MRKFLILVALLFASILGDGQVTNTFGPLNGVGNVWTGTNFFNNGVTLGPILFSQLSSYTGTGLVLIVSDATPGSSPCTGSGSGALAIYVSGAWNCSGAAGTVITVNGGAALGSPTNFQNGTGTTVTNPSGNNVQYNITAGAGFPAAQIGDTVRYNVNGDSSWNAVNFAYKQGVIFYDYSNGISAYGVSDNTAVSHVGTATNEYPTTYGTICDGGEYVQYASSSGASTSPGVGISWPASGNYSIIPLGAWYRISGCLKANQTTNARFWLGLGTWCNGSGVGNNNSVILTGTAYASDTPNKNTLGFRYSATTDTTWKAVADTAGGSQTTVDTLVAIDTNPHLFEMVNTVPGSTITYFIDHGQVAQITTNVPSGEYTGTCDSLGSLFWTGDNKNTANVVSAMFYWMSISLK